MLLDKENALWKHSIVQHGEVRAVLSMTVVGVHKSPKRTPLVRKVNGAVIIV